MADVRHRSGDALSASDALARAFADLGATFADWPLWTRLALRDIRGRYRRTLFGPFWTVLGNGATVAALGLVYAYLWNVDTRNFLPYFSAGFITWSLFTTLANEACHAFTSNEEVVKSTRIPLTSHVMRVVTRNLLVFAHNLVLHVLVCLYAGVTPDPLALCLILVGLALFVANLGWICLLLAVAAARFRDVIPLVVIVLHLAFFLTPIIWTADRVAGRPLVEAVLVAGNPLFHLVDAVRAPLLGRMPEVETLPLLAAGAALGWPLALFAFGRARDRIAYWL
jgi:ABC-type polysaccharide/polyol phosphate export permease